MKSKTTIYPGSENYEKLKEIPFEVKIKKWKKFSKELKKDLVRHSDIESYKNAHLNKRLKRILKKKYLTKRSIKKACPGILGKIKIRTRYKNGYFSIKVDKKIPLNLGKILNK